MEPKKRSTKAKPVAKVDGEAETPEPVGPIASKAELKTFLLSVKDRLEDQSAAPIYALSAVNHVMSIPDIYAYLDSENKELARDIWLRIKQSGMQVRNPTLLFGSDADPVAGPS